MASKSAGSGRGAVRAVKTELQVPPSPCTRYSYVVEEASDPSLTSCKVPCVPDVRNFPVALFHVVSPARLYSTFDGVPTFNVRQTTVSVVEGAPTQAR